MTLSIITNSVMAISTMTFSITTFSITKYATFSINDAHHMIFSIACLYAE